MATRKLIERLTPAQEAQLVEYRDDWLRVGLNTEPADRESAEAAARVADEVAGLAPPRLVIWLRSPLEGVVGTEMVQRLLRSAPPLLGTSDGGAQVGDQVRGQVRDQVRDQVGDQVGYSLWGQHDAGWLGWADYFWRAAPVPSTDIARGLIGVARASGWWWALREAVILTERPTLLRRDEEHRLHCIDGPALLYPDGWGIWAHHGVRVPRQVIEHPESLDPRKDILAEKNSEIRRVMVDRFGYDRLIRSVDATRVHEDESGILWRVEMAEDEPLVVVEVVNSTPEPEGYSKHYMLRVPPTVQRAREGVAWGFGMTEREYAPAVES